VQVTGGGTAPAEFHAAARYHVVSDAAGDYALPPLHRVAHVQLQVSPAGPLPPLTRTVSLEWGVSAMTADFIFA
jgi:hypothetical protein